MNKTSITASFSQLAIVLFLLAAFQPPLATAQCDFVWKPGELPPGFGMDDRSIHVWDPDGAGGEPEKLLISARYSALSSPPSGRYDLLTWDGSELRSIINSINGGVSAVCEYNGAIVVAGSFTSINGVAANRIAKWNGNSWEPLGSGVTGSVYSLAVFQGQLIAGGSATLKRWNGSTWTSVVPTSFSFNIYTMAVFRGDLYIGGSYWHSSSKYIAKWDGTILSQLGPGVNSTTTSGIYSLRVLGNDLLVGGNFSVNGMPSINALAKWDGVSWRPMDLPLTAPGFPPRVYSTCIFDGDLIVCGVFSTPSSPSAENIARWDGVNWAPLGDGIDLNTDISRVLTIGNDLFVSGTFFDIGDVGDFDELARWDGSVWRPVGIGISNSVFKFAEYQNRLIAMGIFKHAGGEICRGITRSVGSSIPLHWEPMGEGVTDDVNGSEIARAQAVHHGKLAIGGKFDSVSGTPASNVAEWDGSTWSAMGLGLNGMVFSLCDNNGDLFAGGSFGGAIATWAEGAWTQVGSGFTSVNGARVFSLLSFEGNLIAAGTFDFSGAQIIKNIARWDGHTWWSLGSGLNKSVNCAALYKGDLIVGGFFTSSGNVSCNGIARWDGSSWHPLGAGITPSSSSASPVNSMAVYNDWLIVTGSFVSAGGIPAKGIAAWDGQQWFSIGEVDNSVWDMRVWNGDLVLGGQFKSLGGLPSHYFGRFGPISTSPPVINVHPSAGLRALGDNVSMRVVASGCPAPSYQWFKNGAALFEDVRIHGVFSPAIKIEQITKDDAGRYTCLIDNGVGSDISLPATLRVGSLSAVDLESP